MRNCRNTMAKINVGIIGLSARVLYALRLYALLLYAP